MDWSTACTDWEERVVRGDTLVPFSPLFPDQSETALKILKQLHIVDVINSPTFGQCCKPWVFDLPTALFGAYDEETGRRLIREFFLLVSKKNSKSTLGAGLMLTALLLNWRLSNEFLFLAPTVEVANNAFQPARDAIRADEELSDLLHIQEHLKLITHRMTGATLKVVAADSETVSGKKAGGIWIDELWLFGKRANAVNMMREATGGLMSRPEGFIVWSSTQSDEAPAGIFRTKLDYFRKVRDAEIDDKKCLPIIYEFPKRYLDDQSYTDPKNFYITNPNMGKSVDQEYLEDELRKAQIGEDEVPGTVQGFFAKHLDIEVGISKTAENWAGAEYWPLGAEKSLTLEAILERSEVVTGGIDGGGLDDLFSLGIVGREADTRQWFGWTHALISPEGLKRRKKNQSVYQQFMADGDLTLVDALPDDLEWLVEKIKEIKRSGKLHQIGADPSGLGGTVDALADIGVSEETGLLIGVSQGIRLSGARKTVERKLLDGSFKHTGSALMDWCAGNAKVRATSTASLIERAASGYGKIDPLMALFNAVHLMSLNPPAKRSVYQSRGLVTV